MAFGKRRVTPTKPPAPEGMTCPFHKKDMSEVCQTCVMWVPVAMSSRNTVTKEVTTYNEYGCTLPWILRIQIEANAEMRGAAAAVEDTRNAVDAQTKAYLGHSADAIKRLT